MPNNSNHRAATTTALLILPLSNGHLMVSSVRRTDHSTLKILNQWYPQMIDALALLQKGDLDYIAGRGAVAMHRDLNGAWQEHQPQFFIDSKAMARYAKAQCIKRIFWHSLAVDQGEKSQPQVSSTRLTIFKGWQELWLTP